jgi:hypothetical protein
VYCPAKGYALRRKHLELPEGIDLIKTAGFLSWSFAVQKQRYKYCFVLPTKLHAFFVMAL